MATVAAAAAFSASCLAARREALRFVRGAIVGATLLGRGRGLIGTLSVSVNLAAVALEREVKVLGGCVSDLMAATDDARGMA